MFKHLLKARYAAVVVVVVALFHALTFLFLGTKVAFETYVHVLRGEEGARPGLELLHSLDLLLVALVMLILALGVAKLFLLPPGFSAESVGFPSWLNIETFGELKVLLWETILMALLVIALSDLTSALIGRLEWNALLLPAAILLLALSLFLMKRA